MNIQKNFLSRSVSITLYLVTIFILVMVSAGYKVNSTKAASVAATGFLQICQNAEGPGLENQVFSLRIRTVIYEVPVGGCTAPIEVPAGSVTIEELVDGRTLPTGTFSGRFRVLSVTSSVAGSVQSVNLPLRTAVVNVREGSVANQTIVTFTNTYAVNTVIEICKSEATPIPSGIKAFFNYTVDVLQNTVIEVPLGGCSGPIQVNVPVFPSPFVGRGDVIVTELGREGFTLESVVVTPDTNSFPGNRLNEFVSGVGVSNTNLGCINERRDLVTNSVITGFALPPNCFFTNPRGGYASVDILEGGTASQTKIIFLNRATRARRTAFDYDGDARADISVIRPSTNRWYELLSSNSSVAEQTFGLSGDVIAPADYDGDGKTDIGIFRSSSGDWWYLSSIDNIQKSVRWGQMGDIPRPSDFDGDGRADFVLYRPTDNSWYRFSSGTGEISITRFGIGSDKPVIGDFDGDGKSDLAIFRPATGEWWYLTSSDGSQRSIKWGLSTDTPVPADYDGDGKTDFAVYRATEGVWYILNSSNSTSITKFGLPDDEPVPADYDGDGRADIAVYRPSEGTWYLLQSSQGFSAIKLGISTDIPTPKAFISKVLFID